MFGYRDYIIIDAHMPFNPKDNPHKDIDQLSEGEKKRAENVENEWGDIEIFLRKNKDKKIIFIGDLNVYARGTHQFECFVRLFNNGVGMKDLWIESGNLDKTPTEKKHVVRLDYALVSPGLFNSNKCNISMMPQNDDDFIDNWTLSDHRMLIVEIEEENSNGD